MTGREVPPRLLVGVLERRRRLLTRRVVGGDHRDAALADPVRGPGAERHAELVVRVRRAPDVGRLPVARERICSRVRDDGRHLRLVDRVADAEQDARVEDPLDHVHAFAHELLHLLDRVGRVVSVVRVDELDPAAADAAAVGLHVGDEAPLDVDRRSRVRAAEGQQVADLERLRRRPPRDPRPGAAGFPERHARDRQPRARPLEERTAVERRRCDVLAHTPPPSDPG